MYTTLEPQQLIGRLERKYYRKLKAVEERRHRRGLREMFSNLEGVRVRRLRAGDFEF